MMYASSLLVLDVLFVASVISISPIFATQSLQRNATEQSIFTNGSSMQRYDTGFRQFGRKRISYGLPNSGKIFQTKQKRQTHDSYPAPSRISQEIHDLKAIYVEPRSRSLVTIDVPIPCFSQGPRCYDRTDSCVTKR